MRLFTGREMAINGISKAISEKLYHNFKMKKVILSTLILLGSHFFTIAQENKNSSHEEVFTVVEIAPEFLGGTQAWKKHLINNLRYPTDALENNISGRVVVQFTVEKDGSLTDIKVIQGIGGGCDEEAMRIIKLSPKWKAGIQNGKFVRAIRKVPITFVSETVE